MQFPGVLIEKVKAAMLDSPRIWQLIKVEQFTGTMSDLGKNAWLSFKDVVKNFLGNTRATQKLFRSYWRAVERLVATRVLN